MCSMIYSNSIIKFISCLELIFYVMMVVDTLYKPNINADAKHISFVLLKFFTH